MGTGEVRDFSKPNPIPQEQTQQIQRLSTETGVENVEVRLHEQLVVEDDKLRVEKRKPGDPEIRIRVGDTTAWEKIKRGDDE
jgi:hypothetical protein